MAQEKFRLRKRLAAEPGVEEILHAWLDAIADRDFDRARRYLADTGFEHRSPISHGDDADAYIADISRVGAILESVETRKVFARGNEVCVVVDYVTHMDKRRVTPAVHLMRIDRGKIAAIETFFDARSYAEMFTVEKDE